MLAPSLTRVPGTEVVVEELKRILRENPVRDEDAGDLEAMRTAWLEFIARKYPQYL